MYREYKEVADIYQVNRLVEEGYQLVTAFTKIAEQRDSKSVYSPDGQVRYEDVRYPMYMTVYILGRSELANTLYQK